MENNKFYKDIIRDELLTFFDEIINNKDDYQANDVFRVRFLIANISEVVDVIAAGEANRRAVNSTEYKQALDEYGIDFAMLVKERIMQEEYKSFGYDKGLPTLEERKMMIRRHNFNIKYLSSHGASSEYIEIVKYNNQLELNLFDCKRGEFYKQFGNNDRLIVKISHDVYVEGLDGIIEAKRRYRNKFEEFKNKKCYYSQPR